MYMYIVHVYIMHYVTYAGLYAIVLHCVQFGILSLFLYNVIILWSFYYDDDVLKEL